MKKNEEEGCLSFTKGTIINVLRRVDKNWAEGRIGNSIGIFPISFVDMNPIAKRLMEISLKSVEDMAVRASPAMSAAVASFETSLLDSSSSSVSSPSNNTSSSNSSTTPNSPVNNQNESSAVTPATASSTTTTTTANKRAMREKRNSLTDATARSATTTTASNRHSTEITDTNHHRSSETGNVVAVRQPRGHQRSKSGHQTSTQPKHLQPYIALYPYKPQKADELELKKGSIYYVTEKCQDGWFKGMSRSQKQGVFPGNYVAIVKTKDDSTRSDGRQPIFISQANYQKSLQNNPPDLPPRHEQYSSQTSTACNPLATLSKTLHNSYIDSIFNRKSGGNKSSFKDGDGDPGATALNRSSGDNGDMKPAGKEKKDSSAISFVKRLTKRSKSPTGVMHFSMDNPVFVEDNPPSLVGGGGGAKVANRNLSHPVHVR